MADLSKVASRDALKPGREPHWHRLRPGCFVGFRQSARGGAGTWIARAYDEDARKYRMSALGSFGNVSPKDRFALAKEAAEVFAKKVESGAISDEKIETVADACKRFGADRPQDEARFRRYVYSDPIAKVRLEKLRRRHVKDWRDRVQATPALVSRSKAGEPATRARSPATLNRDMAVFRAALGQVLALGAPNTESAWQEVLRPIKNAVKRRTLYLSREQRAELLTHASAEALPFIRTLCLLPLRPGAIAVLTVESFDPRTSELLIGRDKAGENRRIVVPAGCKKLFVEQSQGKLPKAPLLMRKNGQIWTRDSWGEPIKAAAKAANLPEGVTAYTFRHSVITDLVASGLPLLTVGQISGTSAEMIERHYGHLQPAAALSALAALTI